MVAISSESQLVSCARRSRAGAPSEAGVGVVGVAGGAGLAGREANRKRLEDEYRDELGAWAEMLEDAQPRYASERLCQA